MLFGHHTFDKTIDEYLRDIAAIASDPQTLIFLDTNILAYLYKLHEAARDEFFMWSDKVVDANRLAIPGWAASEYLSRVTSKSLDSYTPKSKEPSQAIKVLDALHETACLFVDEPLLNRIAYTGNRTAYLNGFRQAIDGLGQYTRAFSQQFDPGVIHQQIVERLSAAILDSDLTALCMRASSEGNVRFEHRLPPGFRDGNKDENRFGDLIIWFEILDTSAARAVNFPKVLFITNDEKSDWVYTPKMRTEIVAGARKAVGNSKPEIKLADPRLVAEFQHRANHDNIIICSLATLVEALSKLNPSQFTQLAAAIQINTQESEVSTAVEMQAEASEETLVGEDSAAVPVEPLPRTDEAVLDMASPAEMLPEAPYVQPAVPNTPRLHYDYEALHDSEYPVDAPSEINAIIKALKSHNWYTQNPAIAKIQAIQTETFTPSSWFVLGRNIYQAACGNSQKAMEFMRVLESQLERFPPETAQHILAGILFEIYFNSRGEFRRWFKFGYADKPLALVADPAYNEARVFIVFNLQDYRERLKFFPGDRESCVVRVVSEPARVQEMGLLQEPVRELQSVTLDGIELIGLSAAPRDPLAELFGQAKLSQERLIAQISEELAIPKWALTKHFEPPVTSDTQFVVPEGQELKPKRVLEAAVLGRHD